MDDDEYEVAFSVEDTSLGLATKLLVAHSLAPREHLRVRKVLPAGAADRLGVSAGSVLLRVNGSACAATYDGCLTALRSCARPLILRFSRRQVAASAAAAAAAIAPIQLQTAVATTSGTSIDFTSIPAGVKRISVHFVGVSTNGGSDYLIQIGDTGGIETSGYLGSSGRLVTGTNGLAYTAGFAINNGTQAASYVTHGSMVLSLVKSSTFTWAANGVFGGSDSYTNTVSGGSKSTSAELDRVRLTTVNGSDVFDAGLVNISWEF